jgi:hypothetical protein
LAAIHNAVHQFYQGDSEAAYQVICERSAHYLNIAEATIAAPFLKFLAGQTALASGRPAEALEFVDPAVYWGQTTGLRLYLADLLHVQGNARLALGLAEDGCASLEEAHREARRQRSRRSQISILLTLYQQALQDGDEARIARLRQEGRLLISLIRRNIEQPAVRQSFLALPGIHELAE